MPHFVCGTAVQTGPPHPAKDEEEGEVRKIEICLTQLRHSSARNPSSSSFLLFFRGSWLVHPPLPSPFPPPRGSGNYPRKRREEGKERERPSSSLSSAFSSFPPPSFGCLSYQPRYPSPSSHFIFRLGRDLLLLLRFHCQWGRKAIFNPPSQKKEPQPPTRPFAADGQPHPDLSFLPFSILRREGGRREAKYWNGKCHASPLPSHSCGLCFAALKIWSPTRNRKEMRKFLFTPFPLFPGL